MVAGSSLCVLSNRRKGFLGNFYHVIESDHYDDELRLNDPSTHKVHLRLNGILTWFVIEMAKRYVIPLKLK